LTDHILKKIVGPVVPYITVVPGLLIFHNAWVTLFSYHIIMIAAVILSREPIKWKEFFRSTNRLIPVITTLIGAAGGIILFLLWPRLEVPSDMNIYLQNIGLTQAAWPFFIGYFVLVNPWIEEYYWRCFLGVDSKTVKLNDVIFAGYHVVILAGKVDFIWLIAVLVILTFAAWLWRQANRICHGLLPSLVSHMAADITIIFAIYWLAGR
jgi:hypothetical protein